MKGPVKNALMRAFERELAAKFPQFSPFDADRNLKTWSWKIAPALYFFVSIQVLSRRDQFVVEVSWADTAEFPWGAMGKLNPDRAKGRERLGLLWTSEGEEPVWDISPEKTAREEQDLEAINQGRDAEIPPDPSLKELLPRIESLVADAIRKLDEYGMPLFRRVAAAHGVTLNGTSRM